MLARLILPLVLVASAAFAVPESLLGSYSGKGNWKMESSSGTYTAEFTITRGGEKEIKVSEKMVINTPEGEITEAYDWSAKGVGGGFFDVYYTAEKKAGSGYCFENRCHLTSTDQKGETYEETVVFSDKGMWRMGSGPTEHGFVAWEGVFKKAAE